MAYNIQYSQQYRERYTSKKKDRGMVKKVSIFLFVLCAFVLLCKLQQAGILRELIIPGDADVTVAAMEHLSENLKYGMTFKEAATAFCVEILEHGNVF